MNSVLVVGAGIVGVSTALHLQRQGFNVQLLDREGPAAGTSHGNAGVLAAIAVVPIPIPGIVKKAPRMLLDRNQPLFIKWSYLPKLVPFLGRYISYANDNSVSTIASALAQLLHDCPEQHLELARGTAAEKFVRTDDYLFGYDSKDAFEKDKYVWDLRKKHGYEFSPVTGTELAEYDDNLKGRFGFGVVCHHHGRITDPGAYVKALFDEFVALGGEFKLAKVQNFKIADGKCYAISTDIGDLFADKYVVTSGIWSGQWNDILGVSVPMESERGYHIEYVNPSIKLKSPIMVANGKFVVSSMEGRMRCAGIVELGGLHNKPSDPPFDLLKRQMAQLFPDLKYDRIEEWMGHRPSTVDSLPIIGVCPKADNVLLGFGHQHIGLSAGPKTGRWLARLAMKKNINTDLSVFAADRPS